MTQSGATKRQRSHEFLKKTNKTRIKIKAVERQFLRFHVLSHQINCGWRKTPAKNGRAQWWSKFGGEMQSSFETRGGLETIFTGIAARRPNLLEGQSSTKAKIP
ncbi:MAG: hypothetical protein WBG42_01710 [Cryomorphaceae bacterium]